MLERQDSRRNFLKILGISASAPMLGASALSVFNEHPQIKELNAEQREFMNRYGAWMDEFMKVNSIKKVQPNNLVNRMKLMELSEKAAAFKPEIAKHMEDETFALIFKISLERIGHDIEAGRSPV